MGQSGGNRSGGVAQLARTRLPADPSTIRAISASEPISVWVPQMSALNSPALNPTAAIATMVSAYVQGMLILLLFAAGNVGSGCFTAAEAVLFGVILAGAALAVAMLVTGRIRL